MSNLTKSSKEPISKTNTFNDDSSLKTDSDYEDLDMLERYRELIFKSKYSELSVVDNLIVQFCRNYKIRKSDECSLSNYIITTMETEKIAHECRVIIQNIDKNFEVDMLLMHINNKFRIA